MKVSEKVLNTKTGILNAAIEVLRGEGYAGLSIRNVSKKAGVPCRKAPCRSGDLLDSIKINNSSE